jgi:hypothetical protein
MESMLSVRLIRPKICEAPRVSMDCSQMIVYFLFFMDVIQLQVAETNKYCDQYLGTLNNDDRQSGLSNSTVQETMYFWYLS